jgi:hypothetical protein
MLSPTTFIGIAKALTSHGQAAPARLTATGAAAGGLPATGHSPSGAPVTGTGLIQQVRVVGPSPVGVVASPPVIARPPPAASANPSAAPPPRNLPRGSLLDLSV